MLGRRLLRLLAVILLAAGSLPAVAQSGLTPAGEKLIAHFEVGGQSSYVRKYQRPICPACMTTASGVTIGIGYDLRHNTKAGIRQTWSHHPFVDDLLTAQGLGKAQAVAATKRLQYVITPWSLALDHFRTWGIKPYCNAARLAFGPNFDKLSPWARDALCSLVYNRGSSMVGERRSEMRFIRDVCLKLVAEPEAADGCVARQIRKQKRIWIGTSIEGGMTSRRNSEGNLAEFHRFP